MIKSAENLNPIQRFFASESAGGVVLLLAAILALICVNSPLRPYYDLLLTLPFEVRLGEFAIAKPLLLWINDGLMAVFFFIIGLELKQEFIEGELSKPQNITLPLIGAISGMVVPAIIYTAMNHGDPTAMRGWAIPTATDIAFALAVLALLGDKIPHALKVFLVSLAIFDDLGAILIIAFFYTPHISWISLSVAASCVGVLAIMNVREVRAKAPYIIVGLILWVAMLKSHVHATIAGVILAMFIPLRFLSAPGESLLQDMRLELHSLVMFFILPLFAFANSGISFAHMGLEHLFHPVPMGIALSLVVGKQLGIFGTCFIAIKMKWVSLPEGVTLRMLYGASLLCGIGFTMSLFIGSLAYGEKGGNLIFDERMGILGGSIVAGIAGYLVLRYGSGRAHKG